MPVPVRTTDYPVSNWQVVQGKIIGLLRRFHADLNRSPNRGAMRKNSSPH